MSQEPANPNDEKSDVETGSNPSPEATSSSQNPPTPPSNGPETQPTSDNSDPIGKVTSIKNNLEGNNFYGQTYFIDPAQITDPTIPVAEETLNSPFQFDLNEFAEQCLSDLETNRFTSIQCADDKINEEIMIRIAKGQLVQFHEQRQYIIENLIEDDRPVGIKPLSSLIQSKTIAKGKKSIVYIFESQLSQSNSDETPVFLNSLFGSNARSKGYQSILSQHNTYLVYFFFSETGRKLVNEKRKQWHWPSIRLTSTLHLKLSSAFPGNVKITEWQKQIRQQQQKGLWAKSEFEFLQEFENLISTGLLEKEINERQEILSDPQKLAEWEGSSVKKLKLLKDDYLNRLVLFVATFFDGIGIKEFRQIVIHLLDENDGRTQETNKDKKKIDRNLKAWKANSDFILMDCGLNVAYIDSQASIRFKNIADKSTLRLIFRNSFPHFVQEQGEKLLLQSVFFSETASMVLIKGMSQLFKLLTYGDTTHLLGYQLRQMAQQLNEHMAPLKTAERELSSRRKDIKELNDRIDHINSLEKAHSEQALLALVQSLESGQEIDLIQLEDHVKNVDVDIDGEKVRVDKRDLISRFEEEKAQVIERKNRANRNVNIQRSAWNKLVKRFVRLLFDLYSDDRLTDQVEKFIDDWERKGENQQVLSEVLEHLGLDHEFDSLRLYKRMLRSPERSFQLDAYGKIIANVARNPLGFKELCTKLKTWSAEKHRNTPSITSQYARAFLFDFFRYNEEFKDFGELDWRIIQPTIVPTDQYGEWPPTHSLFAQLIDNNDFWGELMEWLFSEELESAFLAICHRMNPGTQDTPDDMRRHLLFRIAGFVENWHWMLIGDMDTVKSENIHFWNMVFKTVAEKSSRKQQIEMVKHWKQSVKQCTHAVSLALKSSDGKREKEARIELYKNRRKRLQYLYKELFAKRTANNTKKLPLLRFDS